MWRVIVLLCALGATAAHAADTKDWVLEGRFKSQLALAKQGNKDAEYNIGVMYEKGRGVDRNPRKAVEWLSKAARQGHATAMAELGILYFEGEAIAADEAKAFALLSSAANQNIPSAQFYLGRIYELGKGTRRNLTIALKWYRRAAKNGYYPARAKIGEVQALLQVQELDHAADAPAKPAQAATPAPIRSDKQTATKSADNPVRQAILAASWARHQRPAGYLPSSLTTCKVAPQQALTCVSQTQKRSTGQAMIQYRTHATISDFNAKGAFRIRYTNEIVTVTAIKREDEEATTPVALPKLQNEAEHSLVCNYRADHSISCTKDRIIQLHFTPQTPAAAKATGSAPKG